MHLDKIKLRRFALQLYFAGDAKRWVAWSKLNESYNRTTYTAQFDLHT